MLIKKEVFEGQGQFLAWRVEEEEEVLLDFFSEEEQASLKPDLCSLKHSRRRKEFLIVRLLIKKGLGFQDLMYKADGKPYLETHQISISHTDGLVAVLLHPCLSLGIDVEKRTRNVAKSLSRFTSAQERMWLAQAPDNKDLLALFVWCAKEVLYKILTRPSECFERDMEVLPFALSHTHLHILDKRKGEDNKSPYSFHLAYDEHFVWVWGAVVHEHI